VSELKDRQLIVSPGQTTGTVTAPTDEIHMCSVLFRGKTYRAYSMGYNRLVAGDIVSFADIDGVPHVVKASAGYPTRFRRRLSEWAGRFRANMLLQLCMRNAKKVYTYRFGIVDSITGEHSLISHCWDGRMRELNVEYAGVLRSSSSFSEGDPIVLYQKPTKEWIVIGRLAVITVAPDAIDFGNVPCVIGSDPVAVEVIQLDSDSTISIAAPAHFQVSSGGPYNSTATLPAPGGILNVKMVPTAKGTKMGPVLLSSVDASAEVIVLGLGQANIQRSPDVIDFGNVISGQSSTPSTIIVSGNGTTDGITVSAPAEFEVSDNSGGPWSSSVVLPAVGGTVYCRFSPVSDGTKSGEITISNPDDSKNVSLLGTGTTAVLVRVRYLVGTYPPGTFETTDISEYGTFVLPTVTGISFPPGTNMVGVGAYVTLFAEGVRVTSQFGLGEWTLTAPGTSHLECFLWVGEGDPLFGALKPPVVGPIVTIEPL
jgi:hypothetical protein